MTVLTKSRILICLYCLALSAPGALADTKLVEAVPLSQLQIPIVFSAPAETVSLQKTRISAEIEARVVDISARAADEVAAGAVLATLDCRDYQLSLDREKAELIAAQAQLQLAQQRLKRAQSLIERKHISQDVLDQRKSELDAALAMVDSRRIQVEQAATNVSRCVIKSPFRAAVIELHSGVGELARAGTVLLDIQDLDRVEVSAQVVPVEIPTLRNAPEVFLEYAGGRFPLRIDRISPIIDKTTRTREVRLTFTGGSAPVGASGRLAWTAPMPGVPAHLLVQQGAVLGIFIVEGDTASFLPLPDAVEGRPATIDLDGNTLIVTNGRHNLQSGDTVTVAP